MNYREAIQHARSGSTAYCGGKEIRFLTFAEAEPILLEQTPSRRVVRDENGAIAEKDGQIVVETFADPTFNMKRLGLYDVGGAAPVQFAPTAEDIAGDWTIKGEVPETISPEAVDAALAETVVPE